MFHNKYVPLQKRSSAGQKHPFVKKNNAICSAVHIKPLIDKTVLKISPIQYPFNYN